MSRDGTDVSVFLDHARCYEALTSDDIAELIKVRETEIDELRQIVRRKRREEAYNASPLRAFD